MKEQCIFAGFGGQGMLLIGKFLAEAGMENRQARLLAAQLRT